MANDEVVGAQHHLRGAWRGRSQGAVEAERRAGLRDVDPVEAGEPRLVLVHLPVLALAPVRLDQRLLAGDLRVARLGVLAHPRVPRLALARIRGVVATERGQPPVAQLPDAGHGRIQERPVVRRDEQRTLAAPDGLLEPLDRTEVEVVGRLVQEQEVGIGDEQAGQRGARLLPAGELLGRPRAFGVAEAEARTAPRPRAGRASSRRGRRSGSSAPRSGPTRRHCSPRAAASRLRWPPPRSPRGEPRSAGRVPTRTPRRNAPPGQAAPPGGCGAAGPRPHPARRPPR